MNRRLQTCLVGVAALVAALAATSGQASAVPSPADTITPPTSLPAAPPAALPGHVQPLWRQATQQAANPDTVGEPGGYDPAELRAYLNLHGTGQGQTVAIVEAWDVSSAVTGALSAYDAWYGLTPPCSDTVTTGCFPLTITAPAGTRTPATGDDLARDLSFQAESDLDVEIVHAIAPDAAITVVEAYDDTFESMMSAVDYAASLHPAVISNSYGGPESPDELSLDGHCKASSAPCAFSSGDSGNPGEWPAASPDVLAVGGTTLAMAPAGEVRSEVAWQGSGGGVSQFEPRPAYQASADPFPGGRGIPDVSFDADPNSGIATYIVIDFPDYAFHTEFWTEFGGTSVGAPAWSAILAVADQQRAARGAPRLTTSDVHGAVYAKSAKGLADITVGANGVCEAVCTAGPGYDLVTGEGSPRPGIDTYLARH